MGAHFDRLSFVFPAWNEEEMVGHTVVAACEAGEHLIEIGEVAAFEIVLVDDGSTDATPALVDQLATVDDRVRPVHHAHNRGLGAAVRSGVAAASGDVIVYTDADLPFDLLLTAKALRLLRIYDADIVSAYRFDRTGEGPKRFAFSHLYNWLVRSVLWVRVRDVNFAGKVMRREVFDHVTLRSEGSFIDVELLSTAERLGFRIVQFGVDYFPRTRGNSTLASNAVIRGILTDLWRSRRRLRQLQPLPADVRRAVRPQ